MKDIKVKTDLIDHLECDECRTEKEYRHMYLICKWDTENNEYYLSEILCPYHFVQKYEGIL